MSAILIHGKRFVPAIERMAISAAVQQIAAQINADYRGRNPLFIPILNGAFIFAADLIRHIEGPSEVSFVRLSSYKDLASTGQIKMLQDLQIDIRGRDLVLVEDIVDTGLTLDWFKGYLAQFGPASVRIAALLCKPEKLQTRIHIDYLGFEIPDRFVVGYGMDYNEQGRNIEGVYQLEGED